MIDVVEMALYQLKKLEEIEKRCGTCYFFEKNMYDDRNIGWCRRYPILAVKCEGEWCGEWKITFENAKKLLEEQKEADHE